MNAELWRQAGQKLREMRVRAGITRAEMAQCLGWSVAHLANVEAGVHQCETSAMFLYAGALGMDEDALFA